MKMKRILVLLLAVVMTLSVAACKQDGKGTTAAPETKAAAEKPADDKETAAPETEKKGGDDASGEVPTLIWLNGDPGTIPPDNDMVEEEMNKITVDKVGVKVHTLYMNGDTVRLHISSGDYWDMAYTCAWYNLYNEQALKGYFADITEKVKTVTPELYEYIPEILWSGNTVAGVLYGVPILKDYGMEIFWRFDADLYDDLGMEIPDRMSFDDLGTYLAAAKEAIEAGNPNTSRYDYAMMDIPGGLDSPFDYMYSPILGLPFSAMGTEDENKIVFYRAHEDSMARYRTLHEWYKAGYISPEAPTRDQVSVYSAVKSGQGFYGADAIWSSGDNFRQYISRFDGPNISTNSIMNNTAISVNSKYIDESLKYTELINTDKNLRDMLRYGIEGHHFNYTDDGLVMRTDKADGYKPWPFSQASYGLSSVEAAPGVDVDPNMWDVIFKTYEEEARTTNALGFHFDPAPVESELTALVSIWDKYNKPLCSGIADPEVEVPKLVADAEAAGLDKVLAEAQAQFDKWREENNVD